MQSHWKIIIASIYIVVSWIVFTYFTYGEKSTLSIVPIFMLIIQIIISKLFKNKILYILLLLNPVIYLGVYYTIKPTINYINGNPTKMKCCSYRPSEPSFDYENLVFLDYYDDDCDWEGLYTYTIDINNLITDQLISLFGNPLENSIKESNNKL